MKSAILYHNDADGRMSAALVMEAHPDEEFELHEMKYGFDEQEFNTKFSDSEYNKVFLVDFSIDTRFMQILINTCNGDFYWFDHHKTAQETYKCLWESNSIQGLRRLDRSGCGLVYEHFENELKHINYKAVLLTEDYDIWKFNHGDLTRYFAEAIGKISDIKIFRLVLNDTLTYTNILNQGEILYEQKLKRVESAIKRGVYTKINDYIAYMVNTPEDISLLGNTICKEKNVDIAIVYYITDKVNVSLRSIGNVDVAKIAECYNGGGHKNASGFQMKIDRFVLEHLIK